MKYNFEISGVPGDTERIAATDLAQTFTNAQHTKDGHPAIAVLLTCEDNNIRFAFGGEIPTQGATGLGHLLYVGQSMRLTSSAAIRQFQFINAVNGSDAALQATFEFAIGA